LQDYAKLIEVFQTTWSSRRVDDILQRLLEASAKLCAADQGSIIVFDPRRKQMARTLIRQEQSEAEILDHYLNTLLAGWVSRHKIPLLTDNLSATFWEKLVDRKSGGIVAVLSLPLVFQGEIIGVVKMQEVFALLERVIPTEGRVLLEGESGTGKELIARAIHYNGP
jgi:transcriptional regulator with GAF, ATPase, and Fis domain